MDGKGNCVYPNGNYYNGGFKNGLYHGKGNHETFDRKIMTSENIGDIGDLYEGDFEFNKKHG